MTGTTVQPIPSHPKIYHIAHVDRLPSIVADGFIWCDAQVNQHEHAGTTIGMSNIKRRRLEELRLHSYPDLHVGNCVPFYFCPRSVMLYVIYQRNHRELAYRGGQGSVLHFEADLHAVVSWASAQPQSARWAFTDLNAGSVYFEDYNDLAHLDKIDWNAVQAHDWRKCRDGKQAEFLLEYRFPWHLVERIGVYSCTVYGQVVNDLPVRGHRPIVEIRPEWYY